MAALVDANINDLERLATLTAKAGYAQDSCGKWFHSGQGVPTPDALQPKTLKSAVTLT